MYLLVLLVYLHSEIRIITQMNSFWGVLLIIFNYKTIIMTINDKQRLQLEELINEGISCQSSALEGKKKYIKMLQEWLCGVCKENQEEIPFWVYKLNLPKVYIGTEVRVEDERTFYSEAISLSLQELRSLQSNYEMQKRIFSDQKQIKYMRLSLIISIITIMVTVLAKCCTTTIKLEEEQFKEFITKISTVHIVKD